MSRLAIASLAVFLLACRVHPCGEHEADAPAKVADVPLVQEGGKICHADHSSDATGTVDIMYWGDHMSELGVQYMASFDSAGWAQCGEDNPNKNQYCFEKGDMRVSLNLSQTETPRFGAKAWSPSITVFVHWYDLSQQ